MSHIASPGGSDRCGGFGDERLPKVAARCGESAVFCPDRSVDHDVARRTMSGVSTLRAASIVCALTLVACDGCRRDDASAHPVANDGAAPTIVDGTGALEMAPDRRRTVWPPASARPRGTWEAAAARADASGPGCPWGPDMLALPPNEQGSCDQSTCAAAKGHCVWGGFGCVSVCALLTTDVRRPCSDSSECQGMCLAPSDIPPGEKRVGACSGTMMPRGCYNVVRAGFTLGAMCAD